MYAWIKRWLLDGWVTQGPQVATLPGHVKCFTVCTQCRRVFPHWLASMKAAEAKKRGFLGCKCGGLRIQPQMLPTYQSIWWFVIRGWLIRKVLLKKDRWDPRMVILEHEQR